MRHESGIIAAYDVISARLFATAILDLVGRAERGKRTFGGRHTFSKPYGKLRAIYARSCPNKS